MERLKRMLIFARVVEANSLTSAAGRVQMALSSVNQTVAKLENQLQVKLLNRSTLNIGLTDAGKIYYQCCRQMLQEFNAVHEQLFTFNNTPIGTLRIGSSSMVPHNVLTSITATI